MGLKGTSSAGSFHKEMVNSEQRNRAVILVLNRKNYLEIRTMYQSKGMNKQFCVRCTIHPRTEGNFTKDPVGCGTGSGTIRIP